ncbi:MAG TPA: YbaB/EbfC family nucleoid-associated protein [Rhabdochlamydiaceae bacterium]|nr:YbaB/EbfC family nucleoid-associated protein [Rhabdochlamydiaceae bacterium]
MGSGFSKMKKQARAMQEQYAKMREDMKNTEAVGSSGNGLVTVTLNGEKEMKKIQIKPECVDPSDIEGLEDLIKAAYNEASKKIDAESPSLN